MCATLNPVVTSAATKPAAAMPGDDCRRLIAEGDVQIAEIQQHLTQYPVDDRPPFEAVIEFHKRMQEIGRRTANVLDAAHIALHTHR